MSRAQSGKSPISRLAWRFSLFLVTPGYLLVVMLFYGMGGTHGLSAVLALFYWWVMCNLGAFVTCVFIGGAVTRYVIDLVYQTRLEYYRWRQAGGDPYWDFMPWPINPDSNKVRMAITAPPEFDFCPYDGFPVGRRFGNQCRACGTFHDKG